jgi:hypothetical protein
MANTLPKTSIKLPTTATPKMSYKQTYGTTRVGDTLRSAGSTLFSKENVSTLFSAGVGYVSTRLQDSASKKGNQQAIDYENAKARTLAEQNKLLQSQQQAPTSGGTMPPLDLGGSTTPPKSGTPKWVLPVAIGGGVLILGTVVFLAMRGKNK